MYNDKILIQKKKCNQLLSILVKYLNIEDTDMHEVFLARIIETKLYKLKYSDNKLFLKLDTIFNDYKSSINIYEKMLK
tara:strand:- start:280 stop:513 length:234 start_codon:yes stop_codon:yes gene_type:complete